MLLRIRSRVLAADSEASFSRPVTRSRVIQFSSATRRFFSGTVYPATAFSNEAGTGAANHLSPRFTSAMGNTCISAESNPLLLRIIAAAKPPSSLTSPSSSSPPRNSAPNLAIHFCILSRF